MKRFICENIYKTCDIEIHSWKWKILKYLRVVLEDMHPLKWQDVLIFMIRIQILIVLVCGLAMLIYHIIAFFRRTKNNEKDKEKDNEHVRQKNGKKMVQERQKNG